MTPLKIVRKIVKFVRGSAGPLHIFLACMLGMMLGFVPGFNLTLVIGIALLVVLNVNLGLSLGALAVGKLLSLVLAPVTYSLGFWLIHSTPLESLIAAMGDTPVLALLDMHYYCLLGGLIIAIPLGVALGLVVGAAVQKLRKAVVAAGDKYAFIEKLNKNRFYRIFMRVLFGKGSVAEALEARSPVLRKKGLVVAGVLVVVLVVVPAVMVDYVLAGQLAKAMGQANGAEVNVENAELGLFSGRIVLRGVQVTDRANPQRNLVQAETLAGDLSIADLLARRLVIDELTIDNVRTDVPREAPGEVYPREDKPPAQGPVLTDYFENAEEIQKYLDYLKKVREYLEKEPDAEPDQDDAYARARERAEGYFALSAADILPRHPRLLIRRLVVNQVPVGDVTWQVSGENVSSDPRLNDEAMVVTVADVSADDSAAVGQRQRVGIGIGGPDDVATMELLLTGLPVPQLSDASPVAGQGGSASVLAAGSFKGGRLDVPVKITVSKLGGQLREGETILGLSRSTSETLLAKAQEVTLLGVLSGPLDAPRWQTDKSGTLTAMKESLSGAAKAELASQLDSQIDKLKTSSGVDIGGTLKVLSGRAGEEDADSDTPEDEDEGEAERSRPVSDLIRGLGG